MKIQTKRRLLWLVVPLFSLVSCTQSNKPKSLTGEKLYGANGRLSSEEVKLTLNVDFYDLVKQYQEQVARELKAGSPSKVLSKAEMEAVVYPKDTYEALLRRAADSGFRRFYFRVAVTGKLAIPVPAPSSLTLKEVHPRLWKTLNAYDPLERTLHIANGRRIETYVWMTPFDDAGYGERTNPVTKQVKTVDLTGAERGRGQSLFSSINGAFQMRKAVDDGEPIWGFYCFAYPQVQTYWLDQVKEIAAKYAVTGFFFSDRTHSNMYNGKVHYGFNDIVVDAYRTLYPNDEMPPVALTPQSHEFDLVRFSNLHGSYYTQLLRNVSKHLRSKGMKLHAKASWGNNDLISYRLGNLHKSYFETEKWIDEKIVDALIIGGDVATHPSPEFVISSYDVSSPINDPRNFLGIGEIYRWLTLFGWKTADDDKREKDNVPTTVTEEVIRDAVALSVHSGVRGVLLHEALLINEHDDWDLVEKLSCLKDSGADFDGDGDSDCVECKATTGTVGCAASFTSPTVAAIQKAYVEARFAPPSYSELKYWLANFKAGRNVPFLKQSLAHQIREQWSDVTKTKLIQQAYFNGRGYAANESELLYWMNKYKTEDLIYLTVYAGVVSGMERWNQSLVRALIQRAYREGRGYGALESEEAPWLEKFEQSPISYRELKGSIVTRLAEWPDAQVNGVVVRAMQEARGPEASSASTPQMRAFVRQNGFSNLVQELTTEHQFWGNQRVDAVIHKAYALKKSRAANAAELLHWRPLFKSGQATYLDITQALKP